MTAKNRQLSTEYLRVTPVGDDEWTFEYPRLTFEVLDQFHEAIDLWHAGQIKQAERSYRQLIRRYPEFIDAYHHLALLLKNSSRELEAFRTWQETVTLGLNRLPDTFYFGRDRLPWLIIENRPFLRAYHGLGLEYLETDEVEKALVIFTNLLDLNPNDNQGIRALAIDCYFRLRRPGDVLRICDRFPDDGLEQVMYGRALALYQLGQRSAAEQALRQGIAHLPLVAKELTKSRHRQPKEMRPGYVTYGGADQAYLYWLEHGHHWRKTAGALEFVKATLQKYEG